MPTVRREFIAEIGRAAGCPLLVGAQQQTKPIIGWLDTRSEVDEFRQGLAEIGFSVGRDVTVDYPAADHIRERPSARAADLVGRSVAADGSYLPIVFPELLFWEDSRLKILIKLLILRWWSQGPRSAVDFIDELFRSANLPTDLPTAMVKKPPSRDGRFRRW